ncbi:hypothetical protein [Lutibacter sp. HS1-25]|uniref:hypothetical protein n=1 Tax=Lutibacter sp. HS1-25 TaxID=2485000 RepID=UPI001013341E|nr:hypothetical protein [Lutibacter sp. HS1-25]
MANSQEIPFEKNEVDEIVDDLLIEDSFNDLLISLTNFHFLYFSLNYSSDTYFSGRAIDVDQFNLTPQITYMNSKGFYASISSIIYSEFIPHWDVTNATVGYGKNVGKDKIFRFYGSLSGYLYSNNDVEGLYNGTANAGIGIQNKKRTLGTQISGSYYFGGESTFQIVSRSYASLKLLKTPKHSLKFRPQLSFITGTQLVDIGSLPLQKEALIKETQANDVNLTSNVYALIYTQLNFPLQYNYKSLDFEVGYNLNIPNALENETDLKNTGFFNIAIGYLIDL